MKHEYPIQIAWSPEDGSYIAMALQLDGCMADGATPEEAVANLRVIINEWVEVAKEDGRPIPEPMTVLDIAREQHEAEAQFRKDVELALNTAVEQVKNQARQTKEERAFSAFGIRRGFEPAGFRSE
jgi:predicted RNase H-like HicB family nuclease